MYKSFYIALIVFSHLSANALTITKIFDGTASYCPQPEPQRWQTNYPVIMMTAIGEDLVITAEKCENGHSVLFENLDSFYSPTYNDLIVHNKYSHVKLIITKSDQSSYRVINLNGFEKVSTARIKLADLNKIGSSLRLNIQMRIDYKASNGYSDFNNLIYGSFGVEF